LPKINLLDDQLIDFMLQHPILINCPIVVTPLGTKLCRPSEVVLDILPERQKGAFTKEDGEKVIKTVSVLSNLPTSKYRTPVNAMRASTCS
jgi:hypothetical protein